MRPPFKMPPQVTRIVLLAAGIVLTYSAARLLLTPSSFKAYGFYRGEALAEAAARPRQYGGRQTCVEVCHSEQSDVLAKGAHKSVSCEGCHGPGEAHAQNPDVKLQVLNFGHCMRCHEANPARPKAHKQIVLKDHYSGSKCTECHVPHHPTEVP